MGILVMKNSAIAIFAGLVCLAACSESTPEPQADSLIPQDRAVATIGTAPADACMDEPGISYICGIRNGEDILQLGNTPWVLVSGMNGELGNDNSINGRIHLVNYQDRSVEVLFPGNNPVFEQNMELFPDCPGPLDISDFSSHGLALVRQQNAPEKFRLYMTSHGAREAVEIFEIDAFLKPTIKWTGCVPMPETSWTNSVAILSDGGFLATQFMDPTGSGMAGVIRREITGHVFEWHPLGEVTVMAGTELSGPNGIVISGDERWVYVAAFGTQEIVRFDRSSTPAGSERVAVGVSPDNIRWSTDGTLYTAGGNFTEDCNGPVCGTGWSVYEIVPYNMRASRLAGAGPQAALQGVSSAVSIGNEIWVGTYGGDRIAILPKP